MDKRIIFHIDVNNAFLSWTAVDLLKKGSSIDIRTIPCVIGGDEKKRTGIVTAKSPIAKKMGVVTAEPLFMARKKCPNLQVFKGDMHLYRTESNKLYEYFLTYTPNVERFSVDECFLDMTGTNYLYDDPIKLAHKMKNEIYNKFGYTVNVGIANNKLCAKMASDFEKPNKVHTLFKDEVKMKMWPLPVSELFMIGKKSTIILNNLGIKTIEDLAKTDPNILKKYFKNHTIDMINSANGIDDSKVENTYDENKCVSVSETFSKDIESKLILKRTLLKQSDRVGFALRKQNKYAKTIAIIYKTGDFVTYSKQMKLYNPINVTEEIYDNIVKLLDTSWKGEPLRLIGIRLSDFTDDNMKQISLFDTPSNTNNDKVQKAIDKIKDKYGASVIMPASLKEREEGDK